MPPRNPELPEGTDHIITGAMETGAGSDASTGSSGGGGTAAPGGDVGFVASGGAAGGLGDGTGGTAVGGSGGGSSGGGSAASSGSSGGSSMTTSGGGSGGSGSSGSGSGGGAAEKLVGQVRDQVYGLREQATEKARELADTGKGRVTSTLNDITEVVNEAARAVDERLGEQYGQYAHRAADMVSSFAQTIEAKSLEDMIEDTRSAVRKSPAIALGTAALLGFALMRVVKAGMPANDGSDSNQGGTGGQGGASGQSGRTGQGGSTANRTNA